VIQARLCVGSPYRDGRAERPATSSAKAPEPAPVLAACVSCGEQVDLAATQMTEHRAQFDPCFCKDELATLERGDS
jgi:hypothetical protein